MSGQTDFKIIPDGSDLASIKRDLRFHPSTNDDPKVLSREQINRFNQDGFLKGLRIFSEPEANENRRYFDALLARVIEEGGDSYSISTAHLKYARVYDLLAHPRIVAIVRDLLGENVIGWGSHYFCKMPGDGKTVTWHQDASYWPLTPSKTVTVWLAIDDADVDNACMKFLPGSHLHGHFPYRRSDDGESNVLDQTVDIDGLGEPVCVQLKAGEISVHSDLLLHCSDANVSRRRRCGLTLRYCPPEVQAHLGWHEKGVLVSGKVQGNWCNRSRPEQD